MKNIARVVIPVTALTVMVVYAQSRFLVQARPDANIVGNLFALVIAAVGCMAFGSFSYADRALFSMSLKSVKWVEAKATIHSVEDNSFDTDFASEYIPARTARHYEIKCSYKYRVGTTDYYGSRYSFGGHVDQNWIRPFIGDHIRIYYDKNDPAQSVVRRGIPATLLVSPTLAGGAFAYICWACVNN